MAIALVPYVQEKSVSITPDIRFVSSDYSYGYTAVAFEPAYNFRTNGSGYALYIDDNNYIKINCQTSGYVNPSCEIKYNGSVIGGTSGGGYSYGSSLFCGLSINEDTQEGYCTYIVIGYGSYTQYCQSILVSMNDTDGRNKLYNLIKMAIPPTYNWQSVPAITGKNGILQSLVQIKEEAINDGEPVSEATVLSFDSLGNVNIPSVIDDQMPVDPSDITSVTATYLIPALENGTYEGIKLLVKKGSIPTSEQDADKVVNLDEPTSILRIDSKSVGNLDEDSHYYFVVKLVDEIGTEATSEPKDIWTSHDEGSSFDYTGQIQTFTAPKTGIYQFETWGAQGGNATDGTLTARGGYGAYAKGEVLLQQGETIYINVGGQNGYGGGGWYKDILPSILDNNVFNSQYGATMGYFVFEDLITYFPDILPYLGTEKCILVGQINRHPFYNQDNCFVHAQEYEDYDVNATLLIPLGEVKYISNLTCEYMIQKLENTGYNWCRIYGLNINTTTGEVTDKTQIFLDTENRSISWTTISANVNKSLNYIMLFCTSGTVKIRNLRIQ